MRHIIPISGKDSLWTAIIQTRRAPDLPYEYIFNATGAETPEVFSWLDKVERQLSIKIERIGSSLEDIIYEQGILPSTKARYCTRLAKIYPMEDWIGAAPAVVYYGIRADENRVGYVQSGKRSNIVPAYPLREEGQTLEDVWAGLHSIDLMPPLFFWQSLHDMVVEMLGDKAYLIDGINRKLFYQLFAWRSRANCFFCFFQRQYEWVGLLEHHPDLFTKAIEMEKEVGAEGYNWRQDYSLEQLAERAADVKRKRARKIVDFLVKGTQLSLFEDDADTPDLLSVVSCGLLCGK